MYINKLTPILLKHLVLQGKGKLNKINGSFHIRKDIIYFEIPVLPFKVFFP